MLPKLAQMYPKLIEVPVIVRARITCG
jgi:hypothetical protein